MRSRTHEMVRIAKLASSEMFLEERFILPRFLLEIALHDGRQMMLESICTWSNHREKFEQIEAIKSEVRRRGDLLRYCFVSEIWAGPSGSDRPSLSPDRTEYLHVHAQDCEGVSAFSFCKISRSTSGKVRLGKWEDADDVKFDRGVFGGMFENSSPALN